MKKSIKLLWMILLVIGGICLAGAAIYGALYNVPHVHHRFKLWVGLGVLSVGCFIGMKKVYDSWNE
ncbi:MAG: hypothetical protein E7051_06855 [Lentisphaerae bacterium]|nr:hypothetical protein [Lentisphaerota bacterium]